MKVITKLNAANLNFEGKTKRSEVKSTEYPQADAPVSKEAAKAMKNLMTGLMLLGSLGGASMLSSCNNSQKEELPSAVYNFEPTDKVYDNDSLNDSILSQAENIGIKVKDIDGKFVSSKTRNIYDNIVYETKVSDDFDFVTKVIDDGKLTGYIGINISNVPNKGIKIDKFFRKVGSDEWTDIGYEIKSNGARRNSPGVNFVEVYDKNGKLLDVNQEIKGEKNGLYQYSINLPDGEEVRYDFEQLISSN